ncbi:glycosyltransferase family 1 protein [Candidatus Microgenomates bacterium]|nr:MAG: glycosyltransferase family 1 protein [Candidatus Microgenomates bacterium]
MKILQLTVHFSPNLGGVETHLNDLAKELVSGGEDLFVLCYRPLTNPVKWKVFETRTNFKVLRLPWIVGFFYKLVKFPALEFLYLTPILFLATPFVLIFYRPSVIHSHGLVAGFVGVFWAKIFNLSCITTTHSFYSFPNKGAYSAIARWIFSNSTKVLTLSKRSKREIKALGVEDKKIQVFTYWIDLDMFSPVSGAKLKLGINKKFTALFVGRLVEEKGVSILIDSICELNGRVNLLIAGEGPLKGKIMNYAKKYQYIRFVGSVPQSRLPLYYSAADVTVVPSLNEEGFGRVIIESLACNTPVIATNKGATSEAMDNSVGSFINISKDNLVNELQKYADNNKKESNKKCINYARRKYSSKNIQVILNSYEKSR